MLALLLADGSTLIAMSDVSRSLNCGRRRPDQVPEAM